jgi:hypothetical protein
VFVFMSLLMTGCTDQIGEEVGSQSIALQETDWNSVTRGKTSGPIQFRYRLEEHEGRLFKLRIFARSAVGGLEGWNIDVVENGLKLAEGTTALLKANGADSSSVVSRRFEFRDEASEFEAVAVKVEVVVGNQLASKTFKVKLGPDSETAVEICESTVTSCERAVPVVMDIGVGRKKE